MKTIYFNFVIFLFLFLVFCLTFNISSVSAQDLPPDILRIIKKKTLVVAIFSKDLPPFFSIDKKNGKLTGIDIELAQDIANKLGVKLKIIRTARTFDELVDIVAQRKADMVISCLSITLKRALKVNFTEPYINLHQALLINRLKIPERVPIIKWLNSSGIVIGVMKGTSYVGYAKRDYPRAKIKLYKSWNTMIQDLLKGKITAVLYDEIEITRWVYQHPEAVLYVQTKVLQDKIDPIGIAVNWKDSHLLLWLNLYLNDIKRNGKLKFFINKYLKSKKWKER